MGIVPRHLWLRRPLVARAIEERYSWLGALLQSATCKAVAEQPTLGSLGPPDEPSPVTAGSGRQPARISQLRKSNPCVPAKLFQHVSPCGGTPASGMRAALSSTPTAQRTPPAQRKRVEMFADRRKAVVKALAGSNLPASTGAPPLHDELLACARRHDASGSAAGSNPERRRIHRALC